MTDSFIVSRIPDSERVLSTHGNNEFRGNWPNTIECSDPDEIVTGYYLGYSNGGGGDDGVFYLRIRCSTLTIGGTYGNWTLIRSSPTSEGSGYGNTSEGSREDVDCPLGYVATQIRGSADNRVDSLALGCRPIQLITP